MSITKEQLTTTTQIQIPESNNPPIGTVTSSFFVAIDDVFTKFHVELKHSKHPKKSVQLLWFTSVEQRHSIGTMTSNFQASATLVHSLLEMHIMTDSAMPTLRQNLRNNTAIKKIVISRVGHVGEDKENTVLYESTFQKCFLESIEEFPDKLVIKARVNMRSDTAAVTGFDGKQYTVAGKTSSGWDYIKNADASS